ncbi:hypothetical protein D0Z67_18870 [Streptomyces seoulensis]|uniref:Uncharacterized protein n=1 Tax=Streptomyces seoulensis TaxID=73044 RepID=A0A4P6U292_STRSO|nr:hypothetical protein [Streptomyces seoulensis]QBJ92148.1 hypothetical protein D0Z67_18870 [Streptomyces seoulensis]
MTKHLISLYAAMLLTLSLAASLPFDAVAYPATALWTLTAMPSSIATTIAWMSTPPSTPSPTTATLPALTFHLTASALNVGALLLLRKACGRCRVLARA